ncbi:MAG: hypothetical protein NXI32_13705 [bacterium]|nr:hypothetical protein [bacterium]
MQADELLNFCRFLLDFGMLLLIWIVQLIIYPSFLHVDSSEFKSWHYRYTGLITIFVAPLMLGQAGCYCLDLFLERHWDTVFNMVMIAIAWLATIVWSIPCHDRMQKNGFDRGVVLRLISTNWIRTIAWTLVFVMDVTLFAASGPSFRAL